MQPDERFLALKRSAQRHWSTGSRLGCFKRGWLPPSCQQNRLAVDYWSTWLSANSGRSSCISKSGQFRRSAALTRPAPWPLKMRRPIWPVTEYGSKCARSTPVIVAGAVRERLRPPIEHPADMLGLPLVRIADAESFLNRDGDALTTFNVRADAGARPRQRTPE